MDEISCQPGNRTFSKIFRVKISENGGREQLGEKNNILNEDSEGTILISCLLFTLDSEWEESVDPEGLDVGLGEVFVEFPVAVNKLVPQID